VSDYSVLQVAALYRASQDTKYKGKKVVKNQDGEDTTVYEYSERQVALRDKDKAERIQKLRQRRSDLIKKVKSDLKSKDDKTRLTALAVALIDHTYERPGNEDSADDGHFGVTGWLKKHVTFSGNKATLSYVGKSGVKQKKIVNDAAAVKLLKEITKGKKPDEQILTTDDASITAKDINAYLPEGITAKDLRGLHANEEMLGQLKKVRSKGSKLPKARTERDRILKDEFNRALKETAEIVGHEPSTLRSQYLVPHLEDEYRKDGTVLTNLDKTAAAPKFRNYEEAMAWVKKKSREYGGKNKFLSSDEYREAYPVIKRLSDKAKSEARKSLRGDAERAMKEVGVRFGDRVEWHQVGPFMTVDVFTGTVVDKKGIPYVKLDRPVQGKRTVRWHKGFRRVAAKTAAEVGTDTGTIYAISPEMLHRVVSRSVWRDAADEVWNEGVPADFSALWERMSREIREHGGAVLSPGGDGRWDVTIPEAAPHLQEQGLLPPYGTPEFGREATKSKAEKEEEQIRKLLRPDPKKKPPRHDLRKHRIEEEDEDLKGDRADEDKDRSLNYKHVAALYLQAWQKAKSEEAAKKLFDQYKEKNPDTEKTWQEFLEDPEPKEKKPEEEKSKKDKAEVGEEGEKLWKDIKDEPPPDKGKKPSPDAEAVARKKIVKDTVKGVADSLKSNIAGASLPPAVRKEITTALENMDAEQIKTFNSALQSYGSRAKTLAIDGPKAVQKAERALEDLADYDFAGALKADELAQKVVEQAHANAVIKKDKQKQRGKKRKVTDSIDKMQEVVRDLSGDSKYVIPKKVKDVLKKQLEGMEEEKYEDVIGAVERHLHLMQQEENLDAATALAPAEASLEEFEERIDEMDDPHAKGDQIAEAIQATRVVQRHEQREKAKHQANKAAGSSTARIFGTKEVPSDVMDKLGPALEGLDLEEKEKYVEAVQAEYRDIKNRIETDPATGAQRIPPLLLRESMEALEKPSYEGSPEDIGRATARAMAAQTLIADPFTIGGQKVGQVALDDAGTRQRGLQAFEKYQELPQQMRTAAASQIQERLENVDPESPEAKELNRILDGIALAALVDEREEDKLPQIPGREVNEGFAEVARAMAKAGKIDLLLGPVEDFYSAEGQKSVHSAMQSLDDANLARSVKDTMPGMDEYLVGTEETPALPEEKKRHLRQAIIDMAVDNMTVVDRLIRSRLEEAGEKKKARDAKYVAETARKATGKSWWQKLIEKYLKPDVPMAQTRTSSGSLKLPAWTLRDGERVRLADSDSPEESPVLDMRLEYLRALNDFVTKEIGKPSKSHADRAIQRFLETKNPNFLRSEPETPEGDFESAERKKEGRNSRFSLDSRHVLAAGQPSVRAVEPFFVSKRGKQMSTLTREAAQKVTDDLDRIANLFQHNHESLGVPQKIALDFAYRCDLLSDEIGRLTGQEKEAYQQGTGEGTAPGSDDNTNKGPSQPFNPAEIGKQDNTPPQTEPDEPYMKGNFLQKEYNELRNWQEQGLFSNAKAASVVASRMIAKLQGLQAALDGAE